MCFLNRRTVNVWLRLIVDIHFVSSLQLRGSTVLIEAKHLMFAHQTHSHELAEHVLKDTAVLEESNFRVGIESARSSE